MTDLAEYYRKLFELSPDAMLIMEGDRFVDCNDSAARMMRFPSRQALLDRYSGGVEVGSLSPRSRKGAGPPVSPS